MSNQTDHTIVRLRVPPELKAKIEQSADANNRSQSAEMVARLEQSFKSDNNGTGMDISLISAIEDLRQELSQSRQEAREMRMLYIEAINKS